MLRHLMKMPELVAALALFSLMLLTFTDVMLRSIFNAPFQFTADMTRVLMAITVFSVMPSLSLAGRQISVDLLDPLFHRFNLIRISDAIISFICGALLFWPAQRIWVLAERSRSYGDVMEYLGIGLHYIGWFIAAMTALTGIVLLVRAALLALAPHKLEALT